LSVHEDSPIIMLVRNVLFPLRYCASNSYTGNTYQDALMHYRASQCLKATSINLGLILSVGITAEKSETLQLLKTGWMLGIKETELLTIVQAAI